MQKASSSKVFQFSEFSGKWALITGATSGIGEAFAQILARNGTNLLLTGRQKEKLKVQQEEFIGKYHILVEIIPLDLADPSSSQMIFDFCQKKEILISVLINNAGYALRTQDEFCSPEKVSSMLQVMVVSLTELCNRFIVPMKQVNQGWILNVSSIVGFVPAASTLTYCASKRYIIDYSRYLHYELKREGIKVTCLLPGPTITNFSKNNSLPIPKKLLFFYISAEKVALLGLTALSKGRVSIVSGGTSRMIVWISKLIPPSWLYQVQKKIWVKKRDLYC